LNAWAQALGRFAFAVFLAGCATSAPDIQIEYDRAADFNDFETYAFVKEPGTERAGYSGSITTYFQEAISHEMAVRGYCYSQDDPDLLINFFADAREFSHIQPRPNAWVSYGYYGYRFGMYHAWPAYGQEQTTVRYRVGTANIDVVDARRRQLIWEGVAKGRLTHSAANDPRSTINLLVAELFAHYPEGEFTR